MKRPSPFSPHLGTNHAPSDAELPLLRELLEEMKTTAAALAKKTKKSAIKAQRATLLSAMEAHEQLLAPIRRVPVDVLTAIFLTCLEDHDSEILSHNHPSVVLSHVCRDWRRLALQTPRLWSNVDVRIPFVRPGTGRSVADHHSEWCHQLGVVQCNFIASIQRSSPVPIRLTLDSGGGYGGTQRSKYLALARGEYAAFVATILESSSRWEELSCTVWFDSLSDTLLDLFRHPPENFARLARMRVRVRAVPRPSESIKSSLTTMSQGGIFATPSLRSLELLDFWGDIPAAIAASSMPLYRSLKRLEFHAEVPGDYRVIGNRFQPSKLLAALPNLLSCSIKLPGCAPGDLTGRIPMPKLHSLTLFNLPLGNAFTASLDLPSLTSLHIPSIQSDDFHSIAAEELLLQLGHQLRDVTFYPEVLTLSVYSRCIRHLTNVVNLKLCLHPKFTYPNQPYTYLLADLLDPGVCPQLEVLEMRNIWNTDDVMEHAVRDLIVMRRSAEAGEQGLRPRIRKVRVNFEAKKKVDVWSELEARNVDLEGFELHLEYPVFF